MLQHCTTIFVARQLKKLDELPLLLHDCFAHPLGKPAERSAAVFLIDDYLQDARAAAILPCGIERFVKLAFRPNEITLAATNQLGQPMVLPRLNIVELPIAWV